jgi:inner membrane protein
MDPFTQGVVGCVYSSSCNNKKGHIVLVAIIGWLSGMAADLDVFINSKSDPLLFLEYHRQFTHSLFFMPIGGLITAMALYPFLKKKLPFKTITIYSIIGYATHAPLDSCTSYGTQLFWPFSHYRVSWDIISIIDPLFTIPLFIFILFGLIKKSTIYFKVASIFSLLYFTVGIVQNYRVKKAIMDIATTRTHGEAFNIQAKPSFANLIVWKSLYETKTHYYVDAIRAGKKISHYKGDKIKKLNIKKDFPWINKQDVQFKDILRFSWFSQGHLAIHPEDKTVIGDMRYSFLPHKISPLWGIRLDESKRNHHVPFESFRRTNGPQLNDLWKMITGRWP